MQTSATGIGLIMALLMPALPAEEFSRLLPPVGRPLRAEDRDSLRTELERLDGLFAALPVKGENANAAVFLKAVRYALELEEFYQPQDAAKARELLSEAARRIDALKRGESPWLTARGLVVRGYFSPIDGSPQPYALDIPDDAPAQSAPAYIWLHGRGDTATDLHFIAERMKRHGQFHPPGIVVVHPFGRFCTGFKNAGEQDVLDVTARLVREGRIDPARVVLAGFSMGGAGAWLLGAHYTDRWSAVHTGAGFVDVRRYRGLTEAAVAATPEWERTLWGQNDVPDYVRNLLNVPVISYSGEKDKQRASAEIMAQEFQNHGAVLTQLIGPGMDHKYHPEVQKEIEHRLSALLSSPRDPCPLKLSFLTRTLDYHRLHWLNVTGLAEHWKETRVEARIDSAFPNTTVADLTTQNVTTLRLEPPGDVPVPSGLMINIDGQSLSGGGSGKALLMSKHAGRWQLGPAADSTRLRKRPGLQGPIDDAFTAPFLYVLPDNPCADPAVERWVRHELNYQRARWRWLMRGDVRAKPASQVTAEDLKSYHLIVWGDAAANTLVAKVMPALPLQWTVAGVTIAGKSFAGPLMVPVGIFPNPLNPEKYVVLNSGLTFREAHSKTNSLQNPKLPDWAVIDISTPPNDDAPGRVTGAGFFSEKWR